MNRISSLGLERKPGEPQIVNVAKGTKIVNIVNRGGTPTLYLVGPVATELDDAMTVWLLTVGANVPAGAEYCGSVELSGGQLLLHAFVKKGV